MVVGKTQRPQKPMEFKYFKTARSSGLVSLIYESSKCSHKLISKKSQLVVSEIPCLITSILILNLKTINLHSVTASSIKVIERHNPGIFANELTKVY